MIIALRSKEYLDKISRLSSFPKILNIEVTNKCNLACSICPDKKGDVFGFLDLDLLKRILEENLDILSGQAIWLHYGGEPLLHPKLELIIKMLKKNNITTMLSTNGVLLTKKRSYELMDAGLDYIVFSFDGYRKETYEKIRVGSNFELVKDNILNFLKIKEKFNFKTKTQIQFVKTRGNIFEVNDFIKAWKGTMINHINIKSFCTRAGRVKHSKKFLLSEQANDQKVDREPCFYLWETLIILWDGRVISCCQDLKNELVVGNVKDNNLAEIWNSSKLVKLRERQLRGDFSMNPCSRCFDYKKHPNSYFKAVRSKVYFGILERFFGKIVKDEGIEIIINNK